ncbi:TetR family transcriptional regulator [Pseudomonas aeruginosa]|nr:TetR family transcriptional regulator [Pseudomonas aeruginosa]
MTLTVPAHAPDARDKPAGRIRQKNEEAILAAAEEEFARHGFKGTSMNTIAQNVGLPKANLHYYFGNKLGLYTAVLSNILELWDGTFNTLGPGDDPAEALAGYIRAKMEFSRRYPLASRIFAMEIISGGECLTAHFNQDYRSWFRGRAAVFEAWIAAGRMDPVDPVHLIFLLWAAPSTTPTSPPRSAWSPDASACRSRTSPPRPRTWCGSSSRAAA